MKILKNKEVIIIIIVLVIGFIAGFFAKTMFFQNKDDEKLNNASENMLSSKIKDTKYNTDDINQLVSELNDLENRLNEIYNERRDVEAKIAELKNKINNSTNQEFEEDIFENE